MRRTKEEAAITRANLLRAALRVFSAQGYAAATLEDIAREAGVTRGAIYWHFGGKAELYNTLIGEYSALGRRVAQQAIAEGGTLKEILRRVFVRLLSSFEENGELRAVTEMALFKTETTPDLLEGRYRQAEASRILLEGIAEAMRQGVESGALRPDVAPADMARAFMAFQNGAVYLWLLDPQAFSLRAVAEPLADILIAGLSGERLTDS